MSQTIAKGSSVQIDVPEYRDFNGHLLTKAEVVTGTYVRRFTPARNAGAHHEVLVNGRREVIACNSATKVTAL